MNTEDSPNRYRSLARLALLMTGLIVYGSLVPFEYRAGTLDHGLNQFAHMPWLDIQVEGRADWVANLILYVPFGFLLCGALRGRNLPVAILVTAILGSALAAGVEFLQIWAEPRTVSLNDIAAEVVGTLVGIVVWTIFGERLMRATQSLLAGGSQALRAGVFLYLLAYCFVTLFPFDFLVSTAELRARLDDPSAIAWIPNGAFSLRGIFSLILKVALLAPLGAAFWFVWRRGMWVAALAAFALSGLLEAVHWFEHSEQTDAVSIAAAMVGAAAGNLAARSPFLQERVLTSWARRVAFVAAPIYLALLPVVRGWRLGHVSRELIEKTIVSTHWLPFYYHYFSSEGHALASVVSISASFAPLGGLAWAARLAPGEPLGQTRSYIPVAAFAFFLAFILEVGGLITAGNRPDPTNLLIAVVVAIFTQRACEWFARVLSDFPVPARISP